MVPPASKGGSTAGETGRAPGRPRNPLCDGAIAAAVVDSFVEDGYDGMTVDRVAERAGVGRATIYRRWPTKADLLVDAIRKRTFQDIQDPRTGDLAADVESMLTQAQAAMLAEHRLVQVLQIEMQRHPELGVVFRRDFIDERRAVFHRVFQRAIENGQLPPDADVALLVQIGPAVIWHNLTILDCQPDPDLPGRLTAVLLGHAGVTGPATPPVGPATASADTATPQASSVR
jgi:AcrR family transcriptional regulator